jgi:methionine synthase I (cobalamin-dependent)
VKSQLEKNKEILLEEIERYADQKMSDMNATRLCTFLGAYNALMMVCEESEEVEEKTARVMVREAVEVAKNGESDFMCIMAETKMDTQHLNAVFQIIDDHLAALEVMNNRAYKNLLSRLREVSWN